MQPQLLCQWKFTSAVVWSSESVIHKLATKTYCATSVGYLQMLCIFSWLALYPWNINTASNAVWTLQVLLWRSSVRVVLPACVCVCVCQIGKYAAAAEKWHALIYVLECFGNAGPSVISVHCYFSLRMLHNMQEILTDLLRPKPLKFLLTAIIDYSWQRFCSSREKARSITPSNTQKHVGLLKTTSV